MKKFFKIENNGLINKYEINKKREKRVIRIEDFKYLGIGFYLLIPILFGLLLGLATAKVIFFIFLGTIVSFYNLYKITKE